MWLRQKGTLKCGDVTKLLQQGDREVILQSYFVLAAGLLTNGIYIESALMCSFQKT